MEELMHSNHINLLHNPEVVNDVNHTTTDPGDTADIDDAAAIADATATNNPPSDCVTQLENQVKQLSLALIAQHRLAAASSNKEAACTQVFRYKQHLYEQAERDMRDIESQVATATQKDTLASQNEGLANDRLSIARVVIAAQTAREKQVASDHLYSRELQREGKIQEELKEAARDSYLTNK